ncbi:SAM-dependent methyltransferase [Nocardiopsis nanhaiensis]
MAEKPPVQSHQPTIDTSVSHTARIWNYWLGGKDNYPVDRELGDLIQQGMPQIVDNARADRAFLERAVTYLAGEVGIRQFLDIGTGLPTANNTHEVAQSVAPDSRIVYVDNDDLVLAHARALLTSSPQGATEYVHADVCDTDRVLAEAARVLDFSRPVALMLLGVLNFVQDDDEARDLVGRLMDALPEGSYLAITHPSAVVQPEAMEEATRQWNENGTPYLVLRSPERIAELFEGFDLIEPGVTSCSLWRPQPTEVGTPQPVDEFGGVARKSG